MKPGISDRRRSVSGENAPGAPLSLAAARQRRRRSRDRQGLIVLPVLVDHGKLVEAIVRNGNLTEAETRDRALVSKVAESDAGGDHCPVVAVGGRRAHLRSTIRAQ